MQYRTAQRIGENVSLLGYGCLRFSRKGGSIDQEKAERELKAALDAGVNYFDTAYTYSGSEAALGSFLSKGYRDKVYVASKLPHFQCKSATDFDKLFDEQLKRLQTNYIDFYLMHMLNSRDSWNRLLEMGIAEWLEQKKACGAIRHVGFSYHGGKGDFKQVLDAYPWEFCQIQLNYLDAHSQAGLEGLEYAASKGLPVVIMEPLRGGRLADKLPSAARKVFEGAGERLVQTAAGGIAPSNTGDALKASDAASILKSPAAWGLAWLFNLPQVTCVLSGMNSLEQVEENCALASAVGAGFLSPAQLTVFDDVIAKIRTVEKVPCTGCGYCMPCPFGVDIPVCFRAYNTRFSDGWFAGLSEYIMCTTLKKEPSNAGRCRECGRCEEHCPQGISIRAELQNVQRFLEGLPYKAAARFKGLRYRT